MRRKSNIRACVTKKNINLLESFYEITYKKIRFILSRFFFILKQILSITIHFSDKITQNPCADLLFISIDCKSPKKVFTSFEPDLPWIIDFNRVSQCQNNFPIFSWDYSLNTCNLLSIHLKVCNLISHSFETSNDLI